MKDVNKLGKGLERKLYENFIKNNYDLKSLIPKFIRPNQPIRLMRRFIKPSNNNFEYDFFRVFGFWLFKIIFRILIISMNLVVELE